MQIVPASAADEADIKRLLEASELPTADVSPKLLEHFLVLREAEALVAVVEVRDCRTDLAATNSATGICLACKLLIEKHLCSSRSNPSLAPRRIANYLIL
jgi:hypothetical protein